MYISIYTYLVLAKQLIKHITFRHSHRCYYENAAEPAQLACFIRPDIVRAASPSPSSSKRSLLMY